MDEPVEPPFIPEVAQKDPEPTEKLVIEMPFNNDITFPIPLVPGETVGELRQRIGAIIGVEQSRVLISKSSPALKLDIPVEAAAEDNRLQLVVRSSFDFERLRQLIEADRYLPVIPPPEPPQSIASSPVQSPDVGHGFPWRNSSSMMSPRRRTAKKILRVKLDESMTLVLEEPMWSSEESSVAFSPAANELLQKVGFARPQPTPRQLVDQIFQGVYNRGMEYYRGWRERGLPQFLAVFCIIHTTLDALTGTSKLIAFALLYLGGFAYLMCIFLNRPTNWIGFVQLPNIYHNSTDIEVLTARIPREYKENTDTDPKVQKKILNSMRLRLTWSDTIKIALFSLLPSVYADFERVVQLQEVAHITAIKAATNENIKKKEQMELDQKLDSVGHSDPPPANPLLGPAGADNHSDLGSDSAPPPSHSVGPSSTIPTHLDVEEEERSYASSIDHTRAQRRTGANPVGAARASRDHTPHHSE